MRKLLNRVRNAGKLDRRIMLFTALSIAAVLHSKLVLHRNPTIPLDDMVQLMDAPVEHFRSFEGLLDTVLAIVRGQ